MTHLFFPKDLLNALSCTFTFFPTFFAMSVASSHVYFASIFDLVFIQGINQRMIDCTLPMSVGHRRSHSVTSSLGFTILTQHLFSCCFSLPFPLFLKSIINHTYLNLPFPFYFKPIYRRDVWRRLELSAHLNKVQK